MSEEDESLECPLCFFQMVARIRLEGVAYKPGADRRTEGVYNYWCQRCDNWYVVDPNRDTIHDLSYLDKLLDGQIYV